MEILGTESYIGRLLIAMFVVVVSPIIVSKVFPILYKLLKKEKKKSFNQMVKEEMLRFGAKFETDNKSHRAPDDSKKLSYSKTINLYERILETEVNHDIQKSLELFRAAENIESKPFQDISKIINGICKANIPMRDIINMTKDLLAEDIFIKNESERLVMSYFEITQIISARTILWTFYQDALTETSTVSMVIAKRKNKKDHDIYLAIKVLLLSKVGGSPNRLFEMALKSPSQLKNMFSTISKAKIRRAFSLLCKGHGFKTVFPEDTIKMVEKMLLEYEAYKKSYYKKEEARTREKFQKKKEKRQKEYKSKSAPRPHLSDIDLAYKTLGVSTGANKQDAKKAYRKLAMKLHPDRMSSENMSEAEIQKINEDFLKVQNAYELLMKKFDTKKAA